MNKSAAGILLFLLYLSLFFICAQAKDQPKPIINIQETVNHNQESAVSIQVTVRVFEDDTFIDTFTIDDFELLEDGIPQDIDALYLIRKNKIQRREEYKKYAPETERHFYLFFEVSKSTPDLDEALDYFVRNILIPGDNLTVMTPLKAYRMKSNTLNFLPKTELTRQFSSILRKDALTGNAGYRNIIKDLTAIAKTLSDYYNTRESSTPIYQSPDNIYSSFSEGELLTRYASLLEQLENLHKVDQEKLLEFAQKMRIQTGQKNVLLFYQREFIPGLAKDVMDYYTTLYQDRPHVNHNLNYLYEYFSRDLSFDPERMKQIFSDSNIAVHFLFFSSQARHIPGISMQEDSRKMSEAFNSMAQTTGGWFDSSENPQYLLRRAALASENYYILYYTPKDYKADGSFKSIQIRVKNKNYRLSHRAGYFAEK